MPTTDPGSIQPWLSHADQLSRPDITEPTVMLLAVAAMVLGLVLCLVGRPMVRTGVILAGAAIGGAVSAAVCQHAQAMDLLPVWMTAGAAIGAAGAMLLFRVWVGLSTAALLAVMLPVVHLAWHNALPDPQQMPGVEPATVLTASLRVDAISLNHADGTPLLQAGQSMPASSLSTSMMGLTPPATMAEATAQLEQWRDTLDRVQGMSDGWMRTRAILPLWWESLGSGLRHRVVGAIILGAIAGMMLGLTLPNLAVMFQTATLGSVLLLAGMTQLLPHIVADAPPLLPDTQRQLLAVVGLITACAVVIQWTLSRSKADK